MKKIILILFVIFSTHKLQAKGLAFRGFEKGQEAVSFFLGQPTFVRYDKFLSWKRSWSADAGYHFDKYPYFAANYNFYFYNVKDRLRKKDFFNSLMFYSGPGFFFGPDFEENDSDDKIKVGLRGFGGVEYLFLEEQISVKAELGPVYFIEGSEDSVGFQGMVGLTYYLGGIKGQKKKAEASNKDYKGKEKNFNESESDKEFEEFD